MATVVNARDVILQAALPNGRVAGVTMQPNIVVDPSQVTGLGLIINGTKMADIEGSSQIFQVSTGGTATPSSITLTLTLRNIVGTPSLSILSGTYTGGAPSLSGGPVTYTATIAYANMTTDTLSIRASVTESSITYTDDITIVKAREGSNGINAFLTNESHTVPSSDTGIVSSYTGAGGTFKVYQGGTDVSASCTYTLQSNPNSLTTSINSTTGVYSVTAGFGTGIDTATVTYRATFGSTTFDKIFTITKSKAGTAGTAGSRGSRTFYVSGQSSWSDAVATSAASVSGGPIVNDVVTEYNTTNFSQTRFWNGSAWIVVNGVVDGNLLVSGTVGASAIAVGAIRTSHLAVTGGNGLALNGDPTCSDPASWTYMGGNAVTFVTVTDGISGTRAIRGTGSHYYASAYFPVQPGKKYRVSGFMRRTSAGTGASHVMYIRILSYTAAGGNAWTGGNYAVRDPLTGAATYEGYSLAVSSSWTKFSGQWVAESTAAYGMLDLHGGWDTNVGGVFEWQDLRVDEMVDSSLVVVGGIDADRIDTRNLTIKDSSGNVIFSAAQNLDLARIQNNYRIQNNLVDSTWWSPNITPASGATANGWSLNGNSTENSFIFAQGPRGASQPLWRMQGGAGGATVGDGDGGFHAPILTVDRTKTYRFAIPFCKITSPTATIFWGIDGVCDLNTTTPNGNPYFGSWAGAEVDQWYLFVGYVFPSGSSGASHTGAGIYNLSTGQLITGGTNYTWQTAVTSAVVRAYQYYGTTSCSAMFAPPIVHVVDGNEPNLNEFFNLNNAMQATQDVRLAVHTGSVRIVGNTATKFDGGGSWNASIYSLDSYVGGAYASGLASENCMFGLNTDPTTDGSYTSIDYAIHMSGGVIYTYMNGTGFNTGVSASAGDLLTVTYDGSLVRWLRNGVVCRDLAVAANLRLYFDSSLYGVGDSIPSIRFGPYGNPSAVSPNNQMTAGNITTYISGAAIGSAQIANAAITNAHIANYIASTTFNGTIDGSGNITAPGTAGWAISKGGVAVFDATHIRGQLTVSQIQIPTGAVAAANGDLVNWLGVSGYLGGGGGYSRLSTQQTVLSTGVAGLLIGTITVPNSGQTVTALVNGHMYIYFTSNWSGQAANQHELGVSCTLNLRPITGTTTMGTMLKSESIQRAGWHQLYPNTQQLFPYSVSFAVTNVPAGTYVAYFTCDAYTMVTTTGVTNLYCMNGAGGGGTYIKYNGWVGANAV